MTHLLHHVAYESCDDPDCEIHRIEVGLDEETVTPVQLAFFIAGAQAFEIAMNNELRRGETPAERERRIAACLSAGRPILALAERFRP